jgi:plasmid stabilization system protein ParE
MVHRVRFHAQFQADLRSQLNWLSQHRGESWIEGLRAGLDVAATLLSNVPGMGTIEKQEGSTVLRRFGLRKLPYVLWFFYDTDDPSADVWFVRLFHVRQDRPPVLIPVLADTAARSPSPRKGIRKQRSKGAR